MRTTFLKDSVFVNYLKRNNMGAFISKQPNGLYCRFSTVVDGVTDYNMTAEDYIEMCAEQAREEARNRLENKLYPFEKVKESFRPYNVTIEEIDKELKEMGDIGLSSEDKERLKKYLED